MKLVLLCLLILVSGCAKKETASPSLSPSSKTETSTPTHAVTPAFAGKTWKVVTSSAGNTGATYEFRGDGTLVVNSPGGTPMEGRWSWNQGALTVVEEGISYPTDILALDDSTFKIRSNNPGEPVVLTMRLEP